MTAIVLSDRARERIQRLLADTDGAERFGLRIAVESYGWANRYRLSLAPQPYENDEVVAVGDLSVFVSGDSSALVDGVRIDYVDTAAATGFTFDHPRPARPARPVPSLPPAARRPPSPNVASSPGEGSDAKRDDARRGPARGGSATAADDLGEVDGGLFNRLTAVLDDIRPYLWRDGGDVTIAAVAGGTVWLRLEAACAGCSSAQVTVASVIERRLLEAVPEISRVAIVQ